MYCLFNEQLFNPDLAETLIFEPVRLVDLDRKGERLYFILIDLEIVERKVCEYFLIYGLDLNELLTFGIGKGLLNS